MKRYAATKDGLEYLAPILSSTLTGIVHDSEKRICRMLFKLTVEISMMMHVIAAGFEVNENRLPSLRERCIREIRGTSGSIYVLERQSQQRWSLLARHQNYCRRVGTVALNSATGH